ncbi:MAG: ribosome small subunit-dependent GTPase A [Symploca sp. SIO2G7]|nr:ribosome small subunit-dependent GTPase A [Symploca sp. SIO2G7]
MSPRAGSAQTIARVIVAYGSHGLAMLNESSEHATAGRCEPASVKIHFRRSVGRALPGDQVQLGEDDEVVEILPRTNTFGRGGKQAKFQPLAANIDHLFIVIAPEPKPSLDLLHRYVAAARIQNIEPVFVLNKQDLLAPMDRLTRRTIVDQLEAFNIPVHHIQCKPQLKLGALAALLNKGIHLLVGQSGVGKSTISNALLPNLDLETRALSKTTGKGRHTTTAAMLRALPNGGWLVDSPGVWEYSLWRMPREELARAFHEFSGVAEACRFRDCTHRQEPGCQVVIAVENGLISEFRYQGWLRLLKEQNRLSN